jgi:hypothetical protein
MTSTTKEMRDYIIRAKNGDANAIGRIKMYLKEQAFPLLGEDRWSIKEREFTLESDERSIEAIQIIVEYIEEATT